MSTTDNTKNHMNDNVNNDSEHALDEIEELIDWNLQYNIPLRDSLAGIQRLDLCDYFKVGLRPAMESRVSKPQIFLAILKQWSSTSICFVEWVPSTIRFESWGSNV